MSDTRTLTAIIILVIFMISLSQVRAQSSSIEFVVGTYKVPPSIDGKWQTGEWDNSNEYDFAEGSGNGPYIRMTHDTSNLYGIVDMPSDDGGSYVDAYGNSYFGGVELVFYFGSVLNPRNSTQSAYYFAFNTNRTQVVNVGMQCFVCPNIDPYVVEKNAKGATSLEETVHSSTMHRVWEFSVPLYPYVVKNRLENSGSIGFNVRAFDSSGDQLFLASLTQQATLNFIDTAVPETGQLMMPFVMFASLVLLAIGRKKCV